MKWAYDLTGAEPIIKDELVYDAYSISYGELLMMGATAFASAADAGVALVSAAPSTVGANAAVDAVGIALETKLTSSPESVATANNVTTAVRCYAKVIINPFAIYRAEVLTSSASAVAASATAGKITVTGVEAATLDGDWVYFQGTAGGAKQNLRMVVGSATAGSCLLDAATSTLQTTADTVLFIPQRHRYIHNISGGSSTVNDATVAISQTVGHAATNLRSTEVYIDRGMGMEILKYNIHRQINGLPTTTKFYLDIMMKDHLFGVQEN
jgi:hypothetical protein